MYVRFFLGKTSFVDEKEFFFELEYFIHIFAYATFMWLPKDEEAREPQWRVQ